MDPLARAHQPVHFQLLHAAVGAHAQLSTRGAYLGKYELLQVRVALENLPSHSSCHFVSRMRGIASSPGHSQILSRSRGEIFLHGCEIKSGSGLGTRLCVSLVPRLPRSGTRTLKLCRRGDKYSRSRRAWERG